MILNLDKAFHPFPHQAAIAYEAFTFNGGEPHIRIQSDLQGVEQVLVTHRIRSFNDMGLLLVAVDALERMGVEDIALYLPYYPAARQDRVMKKGEALSVKVYADILNALHLSHISIFDPHSEVAPALLDNCQVISNHCFIQQVVEQIAEPITLIAPDGGALKKIYQLAAFLGGMEVVECSKVRDTNTGALSGFRAYTDDLAGKSCLLVDDICDGGGTFIGLAKELKHKNAGNLYLAVSHGIFSNGFAGLLQHFTHIFTTDAFSTLEVMNGVQQIPLASLQSTKLESYALAKPKLCW